MAERVVRNILLLMASAAIATPALGGTLFDTTFARVDGGKPCYARQYDAAHLQAHPRQTVRGISIGFEPRNEDGKPGTAAAFQLGFSFQLRQHQAWLGDGAYCHEAKGYFDCYLDADGGLFHLTPQNGALALTVLNRGGRDAANDQIAVEGDDAAPSYGFGKPSGDDRSFLLTRAPHEACALQ